MLHHILWDPGAVSRGDTMFVVKVYCKIETSPWALTSLPNQFQKKKKIFWPIRSRQFKHLWNWFAKSKCPGARLDLTVNFHHEHFIDPTDCLWVSEDVGSSDNVMIFWLKINMSESADERSQNNRMILHVVFTFCFSWSFVISSSYFQPAKWCTFFYF